ncbi:MAG: hypothetical protein ACRDD6_12675 [Tannerellaceae bacterium]
MKANNRFLFGAVLTTVLSSCNTTDETDYLSIEQANFSKTINGSILDSTIISIQYDLNESQKKFLLAIAELGEKLLSDRSEAKLFSHDPNSYIQNMGYDESVNIDNTLIQFYKSFSDDDLYDALINNDIKSYVRMCKDRGYLDTQNFTSAYFKSMAEGATIYSPTNSLVFVVPIAVYAIYTYRTHFHYQTSTITRPYSLTSKIGTFPSALLIGDLYNEPDKTLSVCAEFINEEVDTIIDIIKDIYPEQLPDNESENLLRNKIKINFQKYLQE